MSGLLLASSLNLQSICSCRTFWALLVGSLGLWLALPQRIRYGKTIGVVLGIIALGLFASDWPSLFPWTDQGVFWLIAGVTIMAAVATITSQSPVYCAIWFALSLLGTAGLFFFNGAEFLGVATVVVYAGAIVVTFLFVIMLASPEGHASYDRLSWGWFARTASVFAAAAIVGILTMLLGGLKEQAMIQGRDQAAVAAVTAKPAPHRSEAKKLSAKALPTPVFGSKDHMANLGRVLFSQHLVSVEVAGTLLLAALVGAVSIAIHGKRRLETQVEEVLRQEASAAEARA
ncbi:MAG: NADH-quinone oxidoreductase subunit J [Planctomycetales bacterium]|nr:NADH-quinone oxidoreductase subunit J [Planctomycetales bacterium]